MRIVIETEQPDYNKFVDEQMAGELSLSLHHERRNLVVLYSENSSFLVVVSVKALEQALTALKVTS